MSRDQRKYREEDKGKRHSSKAVEPRLRCISCGRIVRKGEQWCKGRDADGYECVTDLRDSNNLIPEWG